MLVTHFDEYRQYNGAWDSPFISTQRPGAFSVSTIAGYSHELSGRLVSLLANIPADILAEATDRINRIRQNFQNQGKPVPSKFQFVGVACATVAELRVPLAAPLTDVIYTPVPAVDNAHSDFVANVPNEDELNTVRVRLTRRLLAITPNEIAARLPNCGK
jgi:hypothetical protein